jgi:hypothetical protein
VSGAVESQVRAELGSIVLRAGSSENSVGGISRQDIGRAEDEERDPDYQDDADRDSPECIPEKWRCRVSGVPRAQRQGESTRQGRCLKSQDGCVNLPRPPQPIQTFWN